jgi:poly(3-hydroxybutyrate) depolymerase
MRASYSVALPGAYDRTFAYPLMVAFRPNGVTTDQFAQSLNLSAVAGSEAIIVYPNPVGDGATWDFMRDGPLFKALLPQMKSDYCVDEARVYALGDGAGALVANLVGCWNADDLRAIAPLSAAPAPPGPCSGSTAVWLVQSTSDAMLGAGMGNRDFWVGHNGCDVRMSKAVAPAQCVEYAGCDPRTPVRYCAHEGDTLPSYAASGAWDFFKSLD